MDREEDDKTKMYKIKTPYNTEKKSKKIHQRKVKRKIKMVKRNIRN